MRLLGLLHTALAGLLTFNYGIPSPPIVGEQKQRRQVRTNAKPKVIDDGLYVRGVLLYPGLPMHKVRKAFGADETRYGKPGNITFLWTLRDKSVLSVTADEIAAVKSASIGVGRPVLLHARTFAVLNGKKIVPGQTSFASVRKLFPRGVLGKAWSGENTTFLHFTVQHGGEGWEYIRFTVSWDGLPEDKSVVQRDHLKVDSIDVGAFADIEKE